MELENKINLVCQYLNYISYNNEEFFEQWNCAIHNPTKENCVNVLVDTMLNVIEKTHDYRDDHINDLKKKEKIQDGKIFELETENKKINGKLTALENKFAEKEEKEYIIILIQAIRNMENYIINKFTNWSDDEIQKYGGIVKFKKNYPQYKDDAENIEKEFGLTKNKANVNKINEKRKLYTHPNPIDEEVLEMACNKFCSKYNGLTDLYKGYMKYYELVRPTDDE